MELSSPNAPSTRESLPKQQQGSVFGSEGGYGLLQDDDVNDSIVVDLEGAFVSGTDFGMLPFEDVLPRYRWKSLAR